MITRTAFWGSLLALGAAATPFSPLMDRASAPFGGHAPGCADVVGTVAEVWGATGEWRSLAPYPVTREASPTSRTGVWIERWHLENGGTELRRVSASQTEVVSLDATCDGRKSVRTRHYNADSLQNAFTDARLDSLMQSTARGIIYVWSPRMPLSVKGLEQAQQAARALGIAFKAIVAETNDEELSTLHVDSAFTGRMESLELVYRNATMHYPTALIYSGGKIIDGAYPGYKNSNTYAQYAKRQFASVELANSELAHTTRGIGQVVAAPGATSATPQMWVDHKAVVTTRSAVNTLRRIGFFFKPITGTNLVSYNARGIDYFFDMVTGKEIQVPGHIDPVPTPDGRFLTLPGLYLHRVPALLAGDETPLFTDRTLPDEYQTASILSETRSAIRYRIVTGWNAGARFRDYDVALDKKGTPTSVTPAGEAFAPCNDRLLTLPINAKAGREFGAYDANAKTNLVLEVTDPAHCTVKLDLGFNSGKLSFSYDGTAIAFATSRVNTDAEGELIRPSESFYKDALVLIRKTGRIVNLSANAPIAGMTFPEFQKDGTVMLLDQFGPGRPVEQLRVVSFK